MEAAMAGEYNRGPRGLAKWGSAALMLGAIVFGLLVGEVVARLSDGRGLFGEARYFGTPSLVPVDQYISAMEAGRKNVGEFWRRSPPPLPNRRPVEKDDLKRLKE